MSERRYAEGLCQQCGSPDISPRSEKGVRCTPCLDRAAELKKARRARLGPDVYRPARYHEWRAAGLCVFCGEAPAPTSKIRCPKHLEIQRHSIKDRRSPEKWTERDAVEAVWRAMVNRCENPKSWNYKNYGARGIRVCEQWRTFAGFLSDMGLRPTPQHSIDRINVHGNYEPGNCRWTTWEVQMSNRTDNHFLTIDGEKLTIAQWSRRSGVQPVTICGRLKRGVPPELAISKEGTRS